MHFFQLLNRNPKHRLGAQRGAAELQEHPFFKTIDWKALSMKQITPPFKPEVESDESTTNFDPEFTSADVRDVAGIALGEDDDDETMDDDDPSEDWLSQSLTGSLHTPNGPLGSDRPPSANGFTNGRNTPPPGRGIQIKQKTKRKESAGSVLSNSVQEKFKGFTFSGGESAVSPTGVLAKRAAERGPGSEDDEAGTEPTTDDEYEDFGRSAGRYAHARRKGLGFTGIDE
jgi:serine/threonine protein kinase SCH9